MNLKQLRKKAVSKAIAAGPKAVQELFELRKEFAQMPPTKKKTRAVTAIRITRDEAPMTLDRAHQQIKNIAQYISNLLGPDATDDHVAIAFDACKMLEKNAETITKMAREEVLRRLKAKGVLEDGTLRLEHNGWALKATRTHTGLDPKKVEARLRERQLDPTNYMTPTISYKLNSSKEDELRHALKDDLADCYYDERWQVAAPEELDTYIDEEGRLMTSSGSNALE